VSKVPEEKNAEEMATHLKKKRLLILWDGNILPLSACECTDRFCMHTYAWGNNLMARQCVPSDKFKRSIL